MRIVEGISRHFSQPPLAAFRLCWQIAEIELNNANFASFSTPLAHKELMLIINFHKKTIICHFSLGVTEISAACCNVFRAFFERCNISFLFIIFQHFANNKRKNVLLSQVGRISECFFGEGRFYGGIMMGGVCEGLMEL